MKIHELAKELDMPDKDVLAKAKSMGIEVKGVSSNLADEHVSSLRNALARSAGGAETKIVKVTPKAKSTEKKDEVVRVTKKANIKPPVRQAKPKTQEDRRGVDSPGTAKTEAGAAAPLKKSQATSEPVAATEAGGVSKAADPRKPAGAAAGRPSFPGGGPAPVRIPASQVVPKRISREELEAEERAKQSMKDGDGAEVKSEKAAGSKKTEAEPKKKAVLKVAWTDTEDAKPATEPASQPEKGDKDGSKSEKPETVVSEMPADDTAAAGDAVATAADQVSAATDETSATADQADGAGDESAADASAPAAASGDKSSVKRTSEGKKPAGKGVRTGQKPAGTPAGSHAGKPDGKAGTERKDETKSKHPQPAPKSKDKKAQKGKDGKGGESFSDKNKKHGVKGERKRGAVDGFRGSGKSPILEDNLLEKRPVRSRPRPKSQNKSESQKTVNLDLLAPGTKVMNVPITVAGFAEQVGKSNSEVIMTLMKLGVMANVNQNLDETTVQLLGDELGIAIFIAGDEGEIVEEGLETFEDKEEDLLVRPPIITVMGHVDHGKTSLLDAIRKTNVTGGEAGGITQHIGASEVQVNGEKIVFLDTPGHEAFTAMRARGAHVTDIAVLVVAADDGVMPQTIESISHAKAAGVPVIVAINKTDKDGANPDKVKQELAEQGVLVEEWGGDTICVPVSAKTGEGIVNLLEMILLQAEVLELRANPNRLALGTVIEARLDKAKGSVATLLVLNGTLETGMSIVAGITSGRIRAMTDHNGKTIKKAGPSGAVEVIGLSEVPQAGDEFHAVREDKIAREIAESRRVRQREEIMSRTSGASLETLFSQIKENEMKELNIIIKGDVQGSVGALTASLEKLSDEHVKVRIIHTGVGAVTESDVMLANTSRAVIIGFNVRPGSSVTALAEQEGVEIRTYRVIYDAIADVDAAMKGMLDPEFREVVLGKVEIRELFKVPGAGVIGGAYVLEGKVQRNAAVRIVRDGIVIHEGKISSLRRFKDDVREVASGYECGIGIENYNDIKEGDIIEAFTMEEIER